MALSSTQRLRLVSSGRYHFTCDVAQIVIIAICLAPFCAALTPEGLALADFKNNVQDPRGILQSWNQSDTSPCKWRGIICNAITNQVMTLNLPRSQFSGTISPRLGELSQLRRLGLHFNNLSGPIPTSLGNLHFLRALYLHNNSLNGTLPDDLGLLPNLQKLDLANNKLEGAIPASYTNMTRLNFLNVSNNLLSGEVPGGAMLNFSASSFTGNMNLCGSALLGLPPCKMEISNTGLWSLWKILVVSVSFFLFLKLVIGLLLLCRWLRMDKNREIHLGKDGKLVMFRGGAGISVPTSRSMLKAVRRIKKTDIVGEGGYGVVYKMVLKNKEVFAVKKLKQCLEATRGFENELETLGEIKHCNLVKLRGYCVAPTSKLLIYDFVPNGTLDQLLHPRTDGEKAGEKTNPNVTWATRVKIARGVARALAYLHHGCEPRIIHRDVSSTNVLLDEEFEPRLSDFGMARLMKNDDTHVTVTVGGTFGYVAPEFARTGQATEKSDVYSYGVILLQLISGRKPTDSSFAEEHVNLSGWVRSLRAKGQEFEIVDSSLRNTVTHRELAIVVEIACRCVGVEPDERPRMDRVAQYLEHLAEFDTTPSSFSLSTAPSMNARNVEIINIPGFRQDGQNLILNFGVGV